MALFQRKSKATMITEVVFPTHKETVVRYDEETKEKTTEELNVPEFIYSFSYKWNHRNRMKGTEEDAKYIIEKLNQYREEEMKDKIKQLIFYYRRATGANDATYTLNQYVKFED